MKREPDPKTIAVAILCGYEVFAITTGKVPTITRLCWRVRGSWPGKMALWLAGGALMYHLLVEEDVVQGVVDTIAEAMP